MAQRSLLIVTFHFPPSAASGTFRILGFVQHLPQLGWQCVVVAPPRLPREPTNKALLGRVHPKTAVYRIPYPDGWLWKPISKCFPYDAWLPLALAGCYRAIRASPRRRLDLGTTPCGPPARHHLRRWRCLPWVADFRDPWVTAEPAQAHQNLPRWAVKAEPSVMREADAIVANTPGTRDLLCRAYPQYASKMTSITNGYDPASFEASPTPPLSGPTIEIVHTGEVYANRCPLPLLEAVRRLEAPALGGRTLRVRLIGKLENRHQQPEIEGMLRGAANASVCVEGQVSYAESIRVMAHADLLLLLDTPERRVGVPAKLYEYIGAGRPILAMAESDGDVAWVLRESGIPHRIASPCDPQAIKRALLEFLAELKSADRGWTNRPERTRFTREHLAGRLAETLASTLDRRIGFMHRPEEFQADSGTVRITS